MLRIVGLPHWTWLGLRLDGADSGDQTSLRMWLAAWQIGRKQNRTKMGCVEIFVVLLHVLGIALCHLSFVHR